MEIWGLAHCECFPMRRALLKPGLSRIFRTLVQMCLAAPAPLPSTGLRPKLLEWTGLSPHLPLQKWPLLLQSNSNWHGLLTRLMSVAASHSWPPQLWGKPSGVHWTSPRVQPTERLEGDKLASIRVCGDTASQKPRQLCFGVFWNLSWLTGYGFYFTTTSQTLLTCKSQQFNTKWLRNKQRISGGFWPSLLLNVTQHQSICHWKGGGGTSPRQGQCRTWHAVGICKANCVSIGFCDLAFT